MANSFIYSDWLSMDALRLLKNKLQVAQFFNTSYNKEFEQEFAVGSTVRIPLPFRFTIRDGLGYTPQPLAQLYTTVACDQVFGVDFEWDSMERALKMPRPQAAIREWILEPAMAQIAQELDSRCAQWAYQNSNNIVGVLGTAVSSFTTINQARQRMIELACPPSGEKGLIIPPSVNTALVAAAIQYFNPASDISKQYKEGSIGKNSGFDWYESMSLYTHTAGNWQGAVSVNTTLTDGATSMVVTCTSGDTFKQGDVIGIGARYAVNPMTRRNTTTATTKTIVLTQDTTASAGTATIYFSPALYGVGSQYQNISVIPTAADVLTLFPGTANPNGLSGTQALAIHKDAFALVGVKLESPKATEITSQTRDPETGLSVRFVRMFDPVQSKMVNRFDCVVGFGNLYNDACSVRLLGN